MLVNSLSFNGCLNFSFLFFLCLGGGSEYGKSSVYSVMLLPGGGGAHCARNINTCCPRNLRSHHHYVSILTIFVSG